MDKPDVELRSGAAWFVWSQEESDDTDPDSLGDITVKPDANSSENFTLTIQNAITSAAGATTVQSIVLDGAGATNWTGGSSINIDSRITGSLAANLVVVKNGSGEQGEIAGLTIEGSVSGTVVAPVLSGSGIWIKGALSGDITVSDEIVSSNLIVDGNVAAGVTIEVENASGYSGVFFGDQVESNTEFEGALVLNNGVPAGTSFRVIMRGPFLGTIDLTGGEVGGAELTLYQGGSGNIINGGEVSTAVKLANSGTFSGSATFSNVAEGGSIGIPVGAAFTGEIEISTDVEGSLEFFGTLAGDIDIGRDLKGTLTAGEGLDSAGRITVGRNNDGTIDIVKGTGSLSSIHIVSGLSSGAKIVVNSGEGNYDAAGEIYVGPLAWITPPNITFDGAIEIYDDDPGTCDGDGGNLTGRTPVVGCHADSTDLDICIDGDGDGNVVITQTGCTYQVSAACSGCL